MFLRPTAPTILSFIFGCFELKIFSLLDKTKQKEVISETQVFPIFFRLLCSHIFLPHLLDILSEFLYVYAQKNRHIFSFSPWSVFLLMERQHTLQCSFLRGNSQRSLHEKSAFLQMCHICLSQPLVTVISVVFNHLQLFKNMLIKSALGNLVHTVLTGPSNQKYNCWVKGYDKCQTVFHRCSATYLPTYFHTALLLQFVIFV